MQVDPIKVAARVYARKLAEAVFDGYVQPECEPLTADAAHMYYERLRDLCLAKAPLESVPRISIKEVCPLSTFEEMDFLRMTMPFGKHSGVIMHDLPLSYMSWLCGQREVDIVSKMERYLAIPRVKERLREELEMFATKQFWFGVLLQAFCTACAMQWPDWTWWEVTARQQFGVVGMALFIAVLLHEVNRGRR